MWDYIKKCGILFYVVKLFELAKRVVDEKISIKFLEWKTRPHLTLACFNNVDENKCIERIKEFAKKHKVIPTYIGLLGMFNDSKTIFVSPVMNNSMYQFQRELHEALNSFDAKGWENEWQIRINRISKSYISG